MEEGVTTIGNYAFENCSNLASLSFPDSITSYGQAMISGCTNLTYLRIGGGVSILEAGVRSNYTNVKNAFYIGDSSRLQTLVIGEGVKGIDSNTFSNTLYGRIGFGSTGNGFTELKTLELPSTLTSIGSYTFYNAPVENLTLASGLASFSYAFYHMPSLKRVTIKGGAIGDYAFAECTALESITMEEGVTTIGNYAFQGCTNLRSLSFPDSITSYGQAMISGCFNLTYLKIGG